MEVRVFDNLAANVSIDRDDAAVSQVEHVTPIQLQCSAHPTSVPVTSTSTSKNTQVVAGALTQLLRSKRWVVTNNHAMRVGKSCLLKNRTDQLVLRLDWNDVVALLSHVLAELNLLPSQLILACSPSNHSWHKPRHLTTALQKQGMTHCDTAYFPICQKHVHAQILVLDIKQHCTVWLTLYTGLMQSRQCMATLMWDHLSKDGGCTHQPISVFCFLPQASLQA